MKVFSGFDQLPRFDCPTVTVGSYDGVHKGHRVLLDTVIRKAREKGGESVVLTFSPHPREVLDPEGVWLLNTLPEKIKLLDGVGIDNLIVVPFDREFSQISYDRFMEQYLVGKIGMKTYVAGYNHHFGAGKQGGPDMISEMAAKFGFEYHRVERCDVDDSKVSSTVIRGHISHGDMTTAAQLLGYRYFVMGTLGADGVVEPGSHSKLLPPPGKYQVLVNLDGHVIIANAVIDPICRLQLIPCVCLQNSGKASRDKTVVVEFL